MGQLRVDIRALREGRGVGNQLRQVACTDLQPG